ncbi:MAG: diphthine synthase [Candidatus Diapherotrites archaeon]|nr:diphthine synthase [Candidatus Diapherotrites archaeon]
MLFLVGAGLRPEHLTLEALDALKKCSRVFFDTYTSSYSQGSIAGLEKILDKKIFALERRSLEEDSKEILAMSKKNDIALLVCGNPLTATTHIQLVLDAKKLGIKSQVIAGVSITNFLGKSGLDEYRFGRACTIAMHSGNFEPDSFYGFICENFYRGLHTLCFLDTGNGKKFLSSLEALEILEKIEKERPEKILEKTVFVAIAGAGADKEEMVFGDLKKIKTVRLTLFPQTLIVCGKLSEKEKEVIGALNG